MDALGALLWELQALTLISVAREHDVKYRSLCEGRDVPVLHIGVTNAEVDDLQVPDRYALSPAELR